MPEETYTLRDLKGVTRDLRLNPGSGKMYGQAWLGRKEPRVSLYTMDYVLACLTREMEQEVWGPQGRSLHGRPETQRWLSALAQVDNDVRRIWKTGRLGPGIGMMLADVPVHADILDWTSRITAAEWIDPERPWWPLDPPALPPPVTTAGGIPLTVPGLAYWGDGARETKVDLANHMVGRFREALRARDVALAAAKLPRVPPSDPVEQKIHSAREEAAKGKTMVKATETALIAERVQEIVHSIAGLGAIYADRVENQLHLHIETPHFDNAEIEDAVVEAKDRHSDMVQDTKPIASPFFLDLLEKEEGSLADNLGMFVAPKDVPEIEIPEGMLDPPIGMREARIVPDIHGKVTVQTMNETQWETYLTDQNTRKRQQISAYGTLPAIAGPGDATHKSLHQTLKDLDPPTRQQGGADPLPDPSTLTDEAARHLKAASRAHRITPHHIREVYNTLTLANTSLTELHAMELDVGGVAQGVVGAQTQLQTSIREYRTRSSAYWTAKQREAVARVSGDPQVDRLVAVLGSATPTDVRSMIADIQSPLLKTSRAYQDYRVLSDRPPEGLLHALELIDPTAPGAGDEPDATLSLGMMAGYLEGATSLEQVSHAVTEHKESLGETVVSQTGELAGFYDDVRRAVTSLVACQGTRTGLDQMNYTLSRALQQARGELEEMAMPVPFAVGARDVVVPDLAGWAALTVGVIDASAEVARDRVTDSHRLWQVSELYWTATVALPAAIIDPSGNTVAHRGLYTLLLAPSLYPLIRGELEVMAPYIYHQYNERILDRVVAQPGYLEALRAVVWRVVPDTATRDTWSRALTVASNGSSLTNLKALWSAERQVPDATNDPQATRILFRVAAVIYERLAARLNISQPALANECRGYSAYLRRERQVELATEAITALGGKAPLTLTQLAAIPVNSDAREQIRLTTEYLTSVGTMVPTLNTPTAADALRGLLHADLPHPFAYTTSRGPPLLQRIPTVGPPPADYTSAEVVRGATVYLNTGNNPVRFFSDGVGNAVAQITWRYPDDGLYGQWNPGPGAEGVAAAARYLLLIRQLWTGPTGEVHSLLVDGPEWNWWAPSIIASTELARQNNYRQLQEYTRKMWEIYRQLRNDRSAYAKLVPFPVNAADFALVSAETILRALETPRPTAALAGSQFKNQPLLRAFTFLRQFLYNQYAVSAAVLHWWISAVAKNGGGVPAIDNDVPPVPDTAQLHQAINDLEPPKDLADPGPTLVWREYGLGPDKTLVAAASPDPERLKLVQVAFVHLDMWQRLIEKLLSAPDWTDESLYDGAPNGYGATIQKYRDRLLSYYASEPDFLAAITAALGPITAQVRTVRAIVAEGATGPPTPPAPREVMLEELPNARTPMGGYAPLNHRARKVYLVMEFYSQVASHLFRALQQKVRDRFSGVGVERGEPGYLARVVLSAKCRLPGRILAPPPLGLPPPLAPIDADDRFYNGGSTPEWKKLFEYIKTGQEILRPAQETILTLRQVREAETQVEQAMTLYSEMVRNSRLLADNYYYVFQMLVWSAHIMDSVKVSTDRMVTVLDQMAAAYRGLLEAGQTVKQADQALQLENATVMRQMESQTSLLIRGPVSDKQYSRLSFGVVEYYLDVVNKLLGCIGRKTRDQYNDVESYFYLIHYLALHRIQATLSWIHRWGQERVLTDPEVLSKKIDVARLSGELAAGIYQFNSLWELLSTYASRAISKFQVHIRINDYQKESVDQAIRDYATSKGIPPANQDKYLTLKPRTPDYEQSRQRGEYMFGNQGNSLTVQMPFLRQILNDVGEPTKAANLPVYYPQVDAKKDGINFHRIYDSVRYPSAEVVASYMSIAPNINQGKGTAIMTYGYSGSGKTHSMFGGPDTKGVLQTAMNELGDGAKVYLRVYEVYGFGHPYNPYWNGGEEVESTLNHCIIHHNLGRATGSLASESRVVFTNRADRLSYILNVQNPEANTASVQDPTDPNLAEADWNLPPGTTLKSTYLEVQEQDWAYFDDFISGLDQKRREGVQITWSETQTYSQIKATVNNPDSSRSILVYDFQIKIKADVYVPFLIYDLPGKEDIYQTYVLPDGGPRGFDDLFGDRHYWKKSTHITNPVAIPLTLSENFADPSHLSHPIRDVLSRMEFTRATSTNPTARALMNTILNEISDHRYQASRVDDTSDPEKVVYDNATSTRDLFTTPPTGFLDLWDENLYQSVADVQSDDQTEINRPLTMGMVSTAVFINEGRPAVTEALKATRTIIAIVLIEQLIAHKLHDLLYRIIARSAGWDISRLQAFAEGYYINENVVGLLDYMLSDISKVGGRSAPQLSYQHDEDWNTITTHIVRLMTQMMTMKAFQTLGSPAWSLDYGMSVADGILEAAGDPLRQQLINDYRAGVGMPAGTVYRQPGIEDETDPENDPAVVLDRIYRTVNIQNRLQYDPNRIYRDGRRTIGLKEYWNPLTSSWRRVHNDPLLKELLEPYRPKLQFYYVFYVITNNNALKVGEEQVKLLSSLMGLVARVSPTADAQRCELDAD